MASKKRAYIYVYIHIYMFICVCICVYDGPQVLILHPASNSIFVSSYHKDKIMVVDSETGKKKGQLGVCVCVRARARVCVCVRVRVHVCVCVALISDPCNIYVILCNIYLISST